MKRGSEVIFIPGRPMTTYCANCGRLMIGVEMKTAIHIDNKKGSWVYRKCPALFIEKSRIKTPLR